MLADLWRLMVALCDVRALARFLTGRPPVDVVFITNLRDEAERQRFFGRRVPRLGHANGPRIYLRGVAGRVRGIFVTAEEMLTRDGRRLAKAQFIAATEWAEQHGARVILLAASTKRLFGRDGAELKARFPHLLFTIGDNGTANMLLADVFRALQTHAIAPGRGRVLVIGPYGILGSAILQPLHDAGYEVVGYGGNASALAEVQAEHGIAVHTRIADIGQVDAVVACTHSQSAKLQAEDVASLCRPGRRLVVVDVAEPANLDIEQYARCRTRVIRQDAGNAYSAQLHYVLGGLSWRLLMLSRGVVFGCFGEALALHYNIHTLGVSWLAGRDWFKVTAANRQCIDSAFVHIGLGLPAPRCFGQPVDTSPAASGSTTANTAPRPGVERTSSV